MRVGGCLDKEFTGVADGGCTYVYRGENYGYAVGVKILRLHMTRNRDQRFGVSL